jgi:hypothetical protein
METIMEFTYSCTTIPGTHIDALLPDEGPSIEATDADMDTIKASLRLSLPDMKPTKRLEYFARSCGYQTAAALQAALNQSTNQSPVVLQPKTGPLDEDRIAYLADLGPSLTNDMRDAFHAASRAVIAARPPVQFRNFDIGRQEQRGCVYSLGGDRPGYAIVEDCPTDLHQVFNEGIYARSEGLDTWAQFPEGMEVLILNEESATLAPKAEELAQISAVRKSKPIGDLPVLRRPEVNESSFRGTLLVLHPDRGLFSFITLKMSIEPVADDIADILARQKYPGYDMSSQELISLRPSIKATNWKLTIEVEAEGNTFSQPVSKMSPATLEKFLRDDEWTMGALQEFIFYILNAITYDISHGELDHVSSTLVVDLITNGDSCDMDYDALALALHHICETAAEMSNDDMMEGHKTEVEVILDPSVYDFSIEVFEDFDIKNPLVETYLEEYDDMLDD